MGGRGGERGSRVLFPLGGIVQRIVMVQRWKSFDSVMRGGEKREGHTSTPRCMGKEKSKF